VTGTLSSLTGSMIWNIDPRIHGSIYSEWGPRELWRAMNPRSRRLEPRIADLRGELASAGGRAALRYAAFGTGLAASGFGG
jgi:hypothetical protein